MYRIYKEKFKTKEKRKMPKLKIILFVGSTREGRLADRVLKFVKSHIGAAHDVVVFDPNEMPFEILKQPIFMVQDPSKIPAFLQKASQEIASADGFIFLSAEYHSSIPPALTNMVDHFAPWDFLHKPSAIITYSIGAFGGCRAGVQLRAFLAEVGCSSVPRVFSIPEAQNALDENGVPTSESMKERLEKNIKTTLDQFYWTASALKEYKQKQPPPAFVMP